MDNKQMMNQVRRLFEEVYTREHLNVCDELCASNLKFHDTAIGQAKSGTSSMKEAEETYNKAFPHKKAKIEDMYVADNDKVIVRWSCQGKHEGEFKNIPPTHRNFTISGISIYQFKDGKIAEIWQSWDRLGLLDQLNIVQAPTMFRQ